MARCFNTRKGEVGGCEGPSSVSLCRTCLEDDDGRLDDDDGKFRDA